MQGSAAGEAWVAPAGPEDFQGRVAARSVTRRVQWGDMLPLTSLAFKTEGAIRTVGKGAFPPSPTTPHWGASAASR
jgi:hypothetical protein